LPLNFKLNKVFKTTFWKDCWMFFLYFIFHVSSRASLSKCLFCMSVIKLGEMWNFIFSDKFPEIFSNFFLMDALEWLIDYGKSNWSFIGIEKFSSIFQNAIFCQKVCYFVQLFLLRSFVLTVKWYYMYNAWNVSLNLVRKAAEVFI
jgi:hypothetical protein